MMNRLQQKCILASAGFHLLLAVILITCPAFLAPKPKVSDVQLITIIPDILIDQPFSNPGGSPRSRPPAAAPAPTPTPPAPVVRPEPTPPPQPTREPEPVVTPPKVNTESLEVTKPSARKRPNISLTPVTRPSNARPKPHETPTEDPQEVARLERRERALNAFGKAASDVKSLTGSAVRIDPAAFSGGDGSGASYASYASWVWSFFDKNWVRPEDASSREATVEVTVTIASDGTVIEKRITKRSGDPAVDASVERMLDHVTTVQRPFPEGAKDKERTYIIPFNMKTNRGSA